MSRGSVTKLYELDLSSNPARPSCPPRPTVATIPPPGECRATPLRLTDRLSRSIVDCVSAHAIRHADDGPGSIHDLQAHGPTTVPLPGSPRCTRRGLAPQRTGCVEPDTPCGIALMRIGSALETITPPKGLQLSNSPKMTDCGRKTRILSGFKAAIAVVRGEPDNDCYR